MAVSPSDRVQTISYSLFIEIWRIICRKLHIFPITRVISTCVADDAIPRGIVCVMICLAVLIEHRLVTDRQTDIHRAINCTTLAWHCMVKMFNLVYWTSFKTVIVAVGRPPDDCWLSQSCFGLLCECCNTDVIGVVRVRWQDGQKNEREVDNSDDAALANQKRMNADPLEVMLSNMGYRITNVLDDDGSGEREGGEGSAVGCRASWKLNCHHTAQLKHSRWLWCCVLFNNYTCIIHVTSSTDCTIWWFDFDSVNFIWVIDVNCYTHILMAIF